MLELSVAFFLGWPMILITVILAAIGLFRSDFRFLLASTLLTVPYSWFLSGFPLVRSPAFLMPVFLFCSAWAMRRSREMLAWILAVPFFLMVFLLFSIVSGQ